MLVPRTLIFLTREDEVLLFKGAENKRLWANLYNGVGGHVERSEDILTAAHRELYEETGLISPNLRLSGIVTVDTQTNPGVCIFIFTGVCKECDPINSKEGTLEWIKISQLKNLPILEDLPLLLQKILAMILTDPPFFAYSRYDEKGNLIITFR
jgi:8-oxo-dGTP diphosphatase